MRLGYLVPEFPSQTHAFFWREARAIRDLGHEVVFLSTTKPPSDSCAHEFADEARKQTRYLFPPGPGVLLESMARATKIGAVASYLRELTARNPKEQARLLGLVFVALELARLVRHNSLDHVHIHSCADAAHVGVLAHLICGVPFSLTLHGDLDVYGRDHASKFRYAKFVSVVTRALQEQVQDKIGLGVGKLPVIRMGVDTAAFAPRGERGRSEKFKALTVARMNRTKGHVFALEAIAQLRSRGVDVVYDIAGSGPELESVKQHISRLELGDVVTLHGSVSEGDVRRLLFEADAFLLTSFGKGEAAPVSVMEAMAAGVPVICSRIGGTGEMIEDGKEGFLTPQKDDAAIASALEKLHSDESLMSDLARAARVRAEQDFDFRRNAEALLHQICG